MLVNHTGTNYQRELTSPICFVTHQTSSSMFQQFRAVLALQHMKPNQRIAADLEIPLRFLTSSVSLPRHVPVPIFLTTLANIPTVGVPELALDTSASDL